MPPANEEDSASHSSTAVKPAFSAVPLTCTDRKTIAQAHENSSDMTCDVTHTHGLTESISDPCYLLMKQTSSGHLQPETETSSSQFQHAGLSLDNCQSLSASQHTCSIAATDTSSSDAISNSTSASDACMSDMAMDLTGGSVRSCTSPTAKRRRHNSSSFQTARELRLDTQDVGVAMEQTDNCSRKYNSVIRLGREDTTSAVESNNVVYVKRETATSPGVNTEPSTAMSSERNCLTNRSCQRLSHKNISSPRDAAYSLQNHSDHVCVLLET